MIETRSKRLRPILAKFQGRKRKLVETLLYNAESDSWDKTRLAKEIGVTRTTLYAYMADPELMDALKLCATILYGVEIPHTVRNILTLANSGDIKANELLIKMSGMIQSGPSQVVNVGVSNESVDTTTPFDNPTEALAVIDMELERLNKQRADIAARVGNRLPGIQDKIGNDEPK